jgi:hypothetical protein
MDKEIEGRPGPRYGYQFPPATYLDIARIIP